MTHTNATPGQDWSLTEEIGGEERLHAIVHDFYERLFADAMVGFLFAGHDIERLVDMQVEYVRARLGDEDVTYTGKPIRAAHADLPILSGHFDRRHALLVDVLEEYDVPEHVREAWIELDASLRDLVVRTGGEAREEMLEEQRREESDGGEEE